MRRILFVLLFFLLLILVLNFSLLRYALTMGIGQLQISYKARPITEVLLDASVPDSVKSKLSLVNEIKKFAVDSLGLKDSRNYTTFYDQNGKSVLWVLTASEKFKLRSYQWQFPVVGAVPYKGFFDKESALKEEKKLKDLGFDTDLGTTGGWSTLGWFSDPVLSGMLSHSEGSLANLIIHEMTHGTVYMKDSTELDENLASYVGETGARLFLEKRYGKSSREYLSFDNGLSDENLFNEAMLKGAKALSQLYSGFDTTMSENEKLKFKNERIHSIFAGLDTLPFSQRHQKKQRKSEEDYPNNAFFLAFIRYDSRKGNFEQECAEKAGSDIRTYISYLKKKYPS